MALYCYLYIFLFFASVFTSFDNFIEDEANKNLIKKYESREIKTLDILLEKLKEKGEKISMRTLKTYIKKIKV